MNRNFAIPLFCGIVLALSACQKQSRHAVATADAENEKVQAEDQTTKDLMFALAGECEANRKYMAYSIIADQEGYPQIARLWRAAAAAEAIHASNHMHALDMLKTTQQNLEGAVEGEQYEFTTMYPRFIKTAKDAGRTEAAQSMEWAFEVEQLHHKMFQADLDELKKGEQPIQVAYWVCGICGNTVQKMAPEVCNICGSPKSMFFEVK